MLPCRRCCRLHVCRFVPIWGSADDHGNKCSWQPFWKRPVITLTRYTPLSHPIIAANLYSLQYHQFANCVDASSKRCYNITCFCASRHTYSCPVINIFVCIDNSMWHRRDLVTVVFWRKFSPYFICHSWQNLQNMTENGFGVLII